MITGWMCLANLILSIIFNDFHTIMVDHYEKKAHDVTIFPATIKMLREPTYSKFLPKTSTKKFSKRGGGVRAKSVH